MEIVFSSIIPVCPEIVDWFNGFDPCLSDWHEETRNNSKKELNDTALLF
jgi:hypothetical protein